MDGEIHISPGGQQEPTSRESSVIIQVEQIDPPPQLGAAVDTSFVLGMGKVKDDVKILLDIDKVLGAEELREIQERLNATA